MNIGHYIEMVSAGIFAPFFKKSDAHLNHGWHEESLVTAIFHALFSAFTGWMAMGWLFVGREWFSLFLRGDWQSPAKVYAYENNGSFMVQTVFYLLLFLWAVPAGIQILLNRKHSSARAGQARAAFICHSYSGSAFGFLLMPVILSLSWKNPTSWRLYLSENTEAVIVLFFFILIFYTYSSFVVRSRREFHIPVKKSLWHLLIPALFTILLVLWEIF